MLLAVLRLRLGPAGRRRAVPLVPPGLPGAHGRGERRLPRRRPLQPVRVLRGPPDRQLRAADPRGQRRPDPLGHHLRRAERDRVASCSSPAWRSSSPPPARSTWPNCPSGSPRCPTGSASGLNLLLLIAFGLKAAVFPLFSWLPDSYPAAPSPVSAVFAGLLTKIGVYAIVRTQTLLFPETNRTLLLVDRRAHDGRSGCSGAIAQSDMKRILSFHIISQIGYMIMGVALGGVAAHQRHDLLHAPPHPGEDLAVPRGGHRRARDRDPSTLDRVSGLARRSGPLAVLFLIPAFSLAGLPPFSRVRRQAGRGVGRARTSGRGGSSPPRWPCRCMTLVSMLKIWTGAFWGRPDPGHVTGRRPGHPAPATR